MRFFALFLTFALTSWSAIKNPILIISVDGLRPDAILKADAKNMQNLIRTGTYFPNATTVRPSITLPSHTSMLTGLDPKQHGIWWNDYQPNLGIVKYPTVFELAKKAGFTTAAIVGKTKFIHLHRPNSLSYFEITEQNGDSVSKAFKKYLEEEELPDITWLHLPDPDRVGHKLGWMSPFYLDAVDDADEAVGNIITVATARSKNGPPIVILTADHGGSGFNHSADNDDNSHIPLVVNGPGIEGGMRKYPRVFIYDVTPTVLRLKDLPLEDNFMGRPLPLKILDQSPKKVTGIDFFEANFKRFFTTSLSSPITLAVPVLNPSVKAWGFINTVLR